MINFINYGAGVDSTAILALLCSRKIELENPVIVFADTGAEEPHTYTYLEYIKKKLEEHSLKLEIVKSKEGSLYDYCNIKKILPMRSLRWCTDRWKRVPLTEHRKLVLNNCPDEYKIVIGIDAGEQKRASRWRNDATALFPLIDLNIDRKGCIEAIKSVGWEVPKKSGCWFCPYAKMSYYKTLKIESPDLFDDLCRLEKETLERIKNQESSKRSKKGKLKIKGWFDQSRPLNEAVEHRYPETNSDQCNLCMYCEVD